MLLSFVFFFSSRRRHTRYWRDWSSDVCSSDLAVLVGKPRVQGKGPRPYALTGTRIELGLQGQEIRLVKALGDGLATGADWRLTADTIHLHLDRKKLQQAFAWGPKDSVHARAVSTRNTIVSDSLAL